MCIWLFGASCCAVRLVLLLEYCIFKGLRFVIEQPQSSLLHLHPRMQTLIAARQAWLEYKLALLAVGCSRRLPSNVPCLPAAYMQVLRVFVRLGDFGGGTAKPTVLYTNAGWVGELVNWPIQRATPTQPLVRRYIDANGRRRAVGTKWLKNSHWGPWRNTACVLVAVR